MADTLGLDPARIERLRSIERYDLVNPRRLFEVMDKPTDGTVVDIGAGVGFVVFPLAIDCPDAIVIACDVLPGMLELLEEDATLRALYNVECRPMPDGTTLPLADAEADLVTMLQVHHELDDPQGLLNECARALAPSGAIAIIDWKDEDLEGVPPAGRRVAASTIVEQLCAAGFINVCSHDIYSHHSCITGYKAST
ncbi:MAG: class I SAM-dependent methyltransferase [Chromatiales bacterium]|jgi:ubiquinone/menaquinone biosynthesis C-methylase UbiE|nr:class I SAM-dependent methyltransferase [Chromatiales bacterium]